MMKKIIYIVSILFLATNALARNVAGNRFVLAQLKTGADANAWDPYPLAARDILSFLRQTTSVNPWPERQVVSLKDPLLFEFPFVVYSGFGPCALSPEEKKNLKKYLSGGGLIFVEDRQGERNGSFDFSFRKLAQELFPDKPLTLIPREHTVYRSFYLLRSVGGRKLTNSFLEGIELDGRTVLIYSQNDVLGAWAKDLFGNYVYSCSPGGEAQRWESQKLMMNLILYSITGTYKTDAIHLPFIHEKLRD